jgi:hypothetical protein
MLAVVAPEQARLAFSSTEIAAVLISATSERSQPSLALAPYTREGSYEQTVAVQL